MVFVPFEPVKLTHEYYRANRLKRESIPEVGESGPSQPASRQGKAGTIASELKANYIAAIAARERKNKDKSAGRKDRKDIAAARMRGGLVKYMLSLGYPLEQAIHEADRALAQILHQRDLSEESASRQVYLALKNSAAMPLPVATGNANDDPFAAAKQIATTPRSLVDFNV